MLIKKYLIKEELTDKQKDFVDTWPESLTPINISKHVIPKGTDSISIPLEDPHDGSHPAVLDHLSKFGYKVSDYKSGKALDKYNREVNIGKVLQKTGAHPEVVKTFINDPNRENHTHGDLQVVITRHPYDVAGMSTDRRWTSCLDMKGGDMNHYLPAEIKKGTHVAYLTHKGDDHAKDPLARIALKPYKEEKSIRTVLIPETRLYGVAGDAFEHTVHKWVKDSFPLKGDTFYMKDNSVYHDSRQSEDKVAADIPSITTEHVKNLVGSTDAKGLLKQQFLAHYGTAAHKDILIDHLPKVHPLATRVLALHANDDQKIKMLQHHIKDDATVDYLFKNASRPVLQNIIANPHFHEFFKNKARNLLPI